jgi:ankyrin repeat protein
MPPPTYLPIFELLMRHGVEPARAKSIAMGELRHWELRDLDAIFKKVKRPSLDFCPFRSASDETHLDNSSDKSDEESPFSFEKWWPSLFENPTTWVSPPREMMEKSVREEVALCVNAAGQWSLRTSGYVALSHVWIEGLQRNRIHDGLEQTKVARIFKTLKRVNIDAEWIWTDVLAIPAGGDITTNVEDEMLTTDIINMLPSIYAKADSVIVLDALTLQFHTDDVLDVAVILLCGKWVTRVWTYQEIKLASRALIITANGFFVFQDIINRLRDLEEENRPRVHALYLFFAILGKNDAVRLSLPDIAWGCVSRKSGHDVDYARAFFPVLGLKWEFGMTREQGMQVIYRTQKRNATRMGAFYGAPRLSIRPGWAPAYLTGLEGQIRSPMEWTERGVQGDWFVLKICKILEIFIRLGKHVFNLDVECTKSRLVQCVLSERESETVVKAVHTAIETGQAYILASAPFSETCTRQTASSVFIVEKADVRDPERFEVAVHCAALITNQEKHGDEKLSVFIRHGNPNVDSDFENMFLYWDSQHYESSRQFDLQHQDGNKLHSAVRESDLALVQSLLEKNEPVVLFDSDGWTPLHVAAARGEVEILKTLLQKARNVDVLGEGVYKLTPLAWAARNGQAQSIRILREYGADINTKDDSGWSPIMIAALECHAETVNELIAVGADPDYLDGFELHGTPLTIACKRVNALETVKVLVEAGADVCGSNNPTGGTPLHRAAELGDEEVVSYLIQHGAGVEAKEFTTLWTPLRYAIKGGHIACVRTLLSAGANRNAEFQNNWTPAHVAASCKKWEIMRMLLEQPMEVSHHTEPEGWTPLHLSLNVGPTAPVIVKLLLNAGADPRRKDAKGLTPLDWALGAEKQDIAEILNHATRQTPLKRKGETGTICPSSGTIAHD